MVGLRAVIDGTGEQEVWIPPVHDVVSRDPARLPCRHCGHDGFHSRTQRCSRCGKRRYRLDVLDFPTAWAIQEAGLITHTDERCSAVQDGAFLCDCNGLTNAWNALRRERGLGVEREDVPRVGAVLAEVGELDAVPERGVLVSQDGEHVVRRAGTAPGGEGMWDELSGAQGVGLLSDWVLTRVAPRWVFVWEPA